MGSMSPATAAPLSFPRESGINFGATVSNVDIEHLTGKIIQLRRACDLSCSVSRPRECTAMCTWENTRKIGNLL